MELVQTSRIMNWEAVWACYDEPTYQEVVSCIGPSDIVLEIGAGDSRLARRIASTAQKVYALEINEQLAKHAGAAIQPNNLEIICADAYRQPFPRDITLAVLLMRHCRHFRIIVEKLLAVGCQRLLTNARWGMGVEMIDLAAEPIPYEDVTFGWYACRCGNVGFIEGPAERLTVQNEAVVHDVCRCPAC